MGDQSLVYYSGLLAQRPHSAAALRAMLSDYFRVPVQVVQFVGRWMHLAEEDCTRLGERRQALGEGAMLGGQLWDQQSTFRLRVGPLTRAQFKDFLPSGKGFVALIRMVQFYVGNALDFDVQLVLRRQDVAHCVLGAADPDQARLGWSTWLRALPFARDADDPVFVVGRRRQRWRTVDGNA